MIKQNLLFVCIYCVKQDVHSNSAEFQCCSNLQDSRPQWPETCGSSISDCMQQVCNVLMMQVVHTPGHVHETEARKALVQ